MKQLIFSFFVLSLLAFSSNVFSEYKTKSAFSNDYKCVSDEKGGFNHEKEGHDLTRFHGQEEFFITHISNIPIEALTHQFNKELDKDLIRNQRENNAVIVHEKDFISEKSTYFIRTPEIDPKDFMAVHEKCTIISVSVEGQKSAKETMYCFDGNSRKQFILNLNEMRFSYSYLGSWELTQEHPNYYGDSSIFAFGTCKKYFR